MAELLTSIDLPSGFEYPPEFVRAVELGIVNLEPWWVLTGEQLRATYGGLQKRYPGQGYVPFASRQDNDDLACCLSGGSEIVIVHDFASAGWERQDTFPNFHAWLRMAIEDFIEWEEIELGL